MNYKQYIDSGDVYVVATRSDGFISRAIRWFSRKGSKLEEYDHVVLMKKGVEIHLTTPTIERRSWERRSYNRIFKVIDHPERAWANAEDIYIRHRSGVKKAKYGKAQLVTKAFTMLFGIDPIKARRDCIEFVLECLIEPKPKWADNLSVGQGIYYLQSKEVIELHGQEI